MRFKETQFITFANQKGGCGKTSSAVSITAAFAKLGYKACLVDIDPQCNATETFGVTQAMVEAESLFTVADAYISERPAAELSLGFGERFAEQLFLVPGNRGLGSVRGRLEAELSEMAARKWVGRKKVEALALNHKLRLKESIKSLQGTMDVVLIDTPPDLDFLMTTGLIATDWFMLPIFPSGYDLSGLETLIRSVAKIREAYNPELKLGGVILGNYDKSARLDREVHELLKKKFGELSVFETTISRSVRHREATFYKQTIFEHPQGLQQSVEYLALVKEFINRAMKTQSGHTSKPLPGFEMLKEVANG